MHTRMITLPRLALILVASTVLSGSSFAQQTYTAASLQRLALARTVGTKAEINYPRADEGKYGDAEINQILSFLWSTQLYTRYRVVDPDKSDLIITITENILSRSVSFVVRDADTNEELYSETRDLVVLSNDVKRLAAHFLAIVPRPPAPPPPAAPPLPPKPPKFVPMSTTLRLGGMRILFTKSVNEDTRAELCDVLEEAVVEEALKDPNFSIQFSSDDGVSVTYKVRYKGIVTNSSQTAMTPKQFGREIQESW
jgi:hypothetical protein